MNCPSGVNCTAVHDVGIADNELRLTARELPDGMNSPSGMNCTAVHYKMTAKPSNHGAKREIIARSANHGAKREIMREAQFMERSEKSLREAQIMVEPVCCLYHQKKDCISVPYEPKDAEYLKKIK